MQRGKKAAEQERAEDSAPDSPQSPGANESGGPSARRSFRENTPEGHAGGDH